MGRICIASHRTLEQAAHGHFRSWLPYIALLMKTYDWAFVTRLHRTDAGLA